MSQPFASDNSSTLVTAARGAGTRVHVPALDGVRGLAVLLVFCFHFLAIDGSTPVVRLIQKTWGMGWMGVDMFFVLSGFLITGILLDAKATHQSAGAYYKNFYARRTVRIFPLYYLFLFLMLIVLPRVVPNWAALIGVPPVGQWAYWTYTYNLFQGHHQGVHVFSHSLGVVWSLCIEEQFYLVWPAIVWFVASPRKLIKWCIALIAISIVSRSIVAFVSGYEVFITQWTFCRMDALGVGAMLAIAMHQYPDTIPKLRRPALLMAVLIPASIIVMNFSGSLMSNKVFLTTGYTLLAFLFGAIVLLTLIAPAGSMLHRFFSNPVMRACGRVSYAMYLFNQPIKYAILKYVFNPNEQLMIAGSRVPAQLLFYVFVGGVTFAVSMLSWHLFEKHFLKLKRFFPMITPAAASQAAAQEAAPRDRKTLGASQVVASV